MRVSVLLTKVSLPDYPEVIAGLKFSLYLENKKIKESAMFQTKSHRSFSHLHQFIPTLICSAGIRFFR